MKSFVKFLTIVFAVILLSTSFACAPKYHSKDFFFFNTQISVVTKNRAISSDAEEKLTSLFSGLEKEFSPSEDNSFTKIFNSLEVGQTMTLSSTAIELYDLAKTCFSYSDGLFNPAVFPLVKAWSFYPDYPILNFTPPSDDKINQLMEDNKLDFSLVSRTENTLKKEVSGMELDFGGILKGFAIDKSAEILSADGITEGYINAGGSSLFIFSSNSLGIKHPRAQKDIPQIISVNIQGGKNLSVSTSGDYEKTYAFNGETYSHLINPKTGYPAKTGVISATVIGAGGGFSDAITTALCLCSHSSGQNDSELLKMMRKITSDYPNAKIFAIFNDGQNKLVLTNQKQGEQFTLLDKEYSVVKI
ncbi:MAG: FAD:protein FMN transferase [Clostridia bacterium]|nr:FAD:protein FMN transferase [Clostridia bacterium]